MKDSIEITIVDGRGSWTAWVRNLAAMITLVFGPISLGIWAGSSAMQWAGFLFGILLFFVAMKIISDRATGKHKTIAEARAYLDKLEGGQ